VNRGELRSSKCPRWILGLLPLEVRSGWVSDRLRLHAGCSQYNPNPSLAAIDVVCVQVDVILAALNDGLARLFMHLEGFPGSSAISIPELQGFDLRPLSSVIVWLPTHPQANPSSRRSNKPTAGEPEFQPDTCRRRFEYPLW
jgi:hypothetical protein